MLIVHQINDFILFLLLVWLIVDMHLHWIHSSVQRHGGIITANYVYDSFVDLFIGAENIRHDAENGLFTCGFFYEFSLFVKAIKFLKFVPRAIVWGEQVCNAL
jgi:hypothetical protein